MNNLIMYVLFYSMGSWSHVGSWLVNLLVVLLLIYCFNLLYSAITQMNCCVVTYEPPRGKTNNVVSEQV